MTSEQANIQEHPDHPEHLITINIQIDRVHYKVHKKSMTGAELRYVPDTPIQPDRDLFQVIPGGPDRKIGDEEVVELRDGIRFFTAPGQINPGRFSTL